MHLSGSVYTLIVEYAQRRFLSRLFGKQLSRLKKRNSANKATSSSSCLEYVMKNVGICISQHSKSISSYEHHIRITWVITYNLIENKVRFWCEMSITFSIWDSSKYYWALEYIRHFLLHHKWSWELHPAWCIVYTYICMYVVNICRKRVDLEIWGHSALPRPHIGWGALDYYILHNGGRLVPAYKPE